MLQGYSRDRPWFAAVGSIELDNPASEVPMAQRTQLPQGGEVPALRNAEIGWARASGSGHTPELVHHACFAHAAV
jgi:hypothetical protein